MVGMEMRKRSLINFRLFIISSFDSILHTKQPVIFKGIFELVNNNFIDEQPGGSSFSRMPFW